MLPTFRRKRDCVRPESLNSIDRREIQVKGAAWRVARTGWTYGATGQLKARPGQSGRTGACVIFISAARTWAGLVGCAAAYGRFEEAYPADWPSPAFMADHRFRKRRLPTTGTFSEWRVTRALLPTSRRLRSNPAHPPLPAIPTIVNRPREPERGPDVKMGIVMCLHRCWIRRVGSAWLVLFAVTLAASASPQGTPPEGAVAAAPADVQLKVETTDGQTTFHIGEVIPLVLSFTSSSLKTYQIDMASYDRSGRLGYEVYAVEPKAGWDDPLKLYFSSRGGWIGGGLRGIDTLSAEPTVIRRELNEWVRFTRPGEYQTKVSSWRVGRLNGPRQPPFLLQGTVITLNIVEATPEWQQQTLERAVAVLNNPGPAGTTAQEKRTEAIKTLRYLGTKAAGVELRWEQHTSEL